MERRFVITQNYRTGRYDVIQVTGAARKVLVSYDTMEDAEVKANEARNEHAKNSRMAALLKAQKQAAKEKESAEAYRRFKARQEKEFKEWSAKQDGGGDL